MGTSEYGMAGLNVVAEDRWIKSRSPSGAIRSYEDAEIGKGLEEVDVFG